MNKKIISIIILTIFLANITSFSINAEENIKINKDSQDYAVIICGGGGGSDILQQAFYRSCNRAYETFKNLGYTDENIIYLSKDIGNLRVDDIATRANIKSVFTDSLQSVTSYDSKVFLYMCDHGEMEGYFILDNIEVIYDYELASWMTGLSYESLTILIECCYSGQFVDDLSGTNRIIMTSTNEYLSAYASADGEPFFSQAFFTELNKGSSYGKAWEVADEDIASRARSVNKKYVPLATCKKPVNVLPGSNEQQIPLIDDNGDGIGHGTSDNDTLPLGGDGSLALDTYPGDEYLTRNDGLFDLFLDKLFEKIRNPSIYQFLEKMF